MAPTPVLRAPPALSEKATVGKRRLPQGAARRARASAPSGLHPPAPVGRQRQAPSPAGLPRAPPRLLQTRWGCGRGCRPRGMPVAAPLARMGTWTHVPSSHCPREEAWAWRPWALAAGTWPAGPVVTSVPKTLTFGWFRDIRGLKWLLGSLRGLLAPANLLRK